MVVVGGILITFIIFSLVINSINNKKPINQLEIFFFVWYVRFGTFFDDQGDVERKKCARVFSVTSVGIKRLCKHE